VACQDATLTCGSHCIA